MAPVSGDVVEKEKKPKKRFSLKSPKKKKEEPVIATTPELVLPPTTPVSPGSVDDTNSVMSAVSISDVSASADSPKKGSRLNMSFRKKKKDLDSNGNEVLRASTQDLAVARDRAVELERELDQSSADLEISKNKITELEKRVSELESVQQDNLEKLDDRKSEIDSLKREINRLKTIEEQHERMKAEQAKASEATAKTTEIAGLHATILNKNSEIETLKARVVDYEASSEISKKCLKTLQDNIETMEVEMMNQAGLTEQEALSHQANIKALEEQVEKGRSESVMLESNFNAQLNAEVQRMAEVQKLVQQELEEKMAELNTLRAQVESGDPELERLKEEHEELIQVLASREQVLASMTAQLTSSEADLALSNATCREGEVQIVELQLKIEELAAISSEMDGAALEEINQLNVLVSQNKDTLLLKDTALTLAEDARSKVEVLLSTALAEQSELSNTTMALSEQIAQGEEERVMLESKLQEYEQESKTRGEDSSLEVIQLQNENKAQLEKIEYLQVANCNMTTNMSQRKESYDIKLDALRKEVSEQLDQIENLENAAQDATDKAEETIAKFLLSEAERAALADQAKDTNAKLLAIQSEKSDLVDDLEQKQATIQSQLSKIESLNEDLALLTEDIAQLAEDKIEAVAALEAEKEEAVAQLQASQGLMSVDNCINYEMIEKGDVEGLGDLVVVQRETVQSLGHSLAEVSQKSEKVEKLEKELGNLTAELEASIASVKVLEHSVKDADKLQEKYNSLSKERDELDSQFSVMEEALAVEEKQSELKDSLIEKSEREIKDQKRKIEKLSKNLANFQSDMVKQEGKAGQKDKQGEKEVIELKGQLNKMTKEAEKNLRENKKTQGQLLDTKANLADLQVKLTKLSEEKRFLEKAMPAPVSVIESVKNVTDCKDRELISKLEKQLSSMQSEKEQVHSEITSAQWQKQMAVAGGLAGAGVASAVAYLTALYSC